MRRETVRVALPLLLCAPALAWTAQLLVDTPLLLVAAATAPATLLAAVVLVVQRGGKRPGGALAFALFWGAAGAALLSTTGNELARAWLDPRAGDASRNATALLVAPALEEVAKALGAVMLLFAAPATLRDARDGIVYGVLIGVGFVWTENFLYLGVAALQAGQEGLLRALYLRGVLGGAAHAVFTACSAAGLGWWASHRVDRGAAVRAAGSIAFAVFLHMAWNAFAAPMIAAALCGAPAGGACIDEPTGVVVFGVTTLVAAVFLAPGVLTARIAWRAAGEGANAADLAG